MYQGTRLILVDLGISRMVAQTDKHQKDTCRRNPNLANVLDALLSLELKHDPVMERF